MDVSSNSVTTVSGQEHKQNTSLTTLTTTKRLLTNNGVRQLQDFNLQTHLDDRIRGDQQQTQQIHYQPIQPNSNNQGNNQSVVVVSSVSNTQDPNIHNTNSSNFSSIIPFDANSARVVNIVSNDNMPVTLLGNVGNNQLRQTLAPTIATPMQVVGNIGQQRSNNNTPLVTPMQAGQILNLGGGNHASTGSGQILNLPNGNPGGQFYVMIPQSPVDLNHQKIAPRAHGAVESPLTSQRTEREEKRRQTHNEVPVPNWQQLGAQLVPTAPAPAAPSPLDKRRHTHNEVERRRRDKINSWIHKLAKMVPNCKDELGTKHGQIREQVTLKSKGGILQKTVNFIQELQIAHSQVVERLQEQNQVLVEMAKIREKLSRVEQENLLLRTQLQSNGIEPINYCNQVSQSSDQDSLKSCSEMQPMQNTHGGQQQVMYQNNKLMELDQEKGHDQ